MVRRLIINADDYGLCQQVNAAIEELIEGGKLTDVSVLANGDCWKAAVDFLKKHAHISVGAHLNLVEGKPVSQAPEISLLTETDGSFVGWRGLFARWSLSPFAVTQALEIEWRAQIERLLDAPLNLSHADSHQHLHAFPPAWSCLVRLCREYQIPGLRLPLERPHLSRRRAAAFALNCSLAVSRRLFPGEGLYHNDHFLGFRRAGVYTLTDLLTDLAALPSGLTEIALHPSTMNDVPYRNFCGNSERQALLDERWPAQLNRLGIELTTWRNVT